ncbi:hypothetical protein MKW98_016093, partial [Papaver atlanticum]
RNYAVASYGGNSSTTLCSLCNIFPETCAHLFWECTYTKQIWDFFCAQANVQVPLFTNLLDLLKNWPSYDGSNSGKAFWKCLPASICWNVWLERNAHCFNSKKRKVEDVIIDAKVSSFHWASAYGSLRSFYIQDVIVNWKVLLFDPP